MELATGDHVAFLTQDSVPAGRGWLAALLGGFALADDVALVVRPAAARGPTPARWSGASCGEFFARFGGAAGRPRRRGAGPATFFSSANGAVARWAWERVPFRPVAYAEDQVLARDMLAAGLAKAYVPDAAVVHSHDLPPLRALRRYFDDFRALAEVHGAPRAADARATSRRASAATSPPTARSCAARGCRVQTLALAAPPRRAGARPQPRLQRRPPARVGARRAVAGRPRELRARDRIPRMSRPVLFVTNHAPPFRVGAFAALHEREDVVFALIGGDVRHGGGSGDADLPFPVLRPSQRGVLRLAASGRFRAVVAGLSGRVALPAAYAGARRARRPVRAVGDDLGASADARARALVPAAAAPVPGRRRDRHVRPARQRLRPRPRAPAAPSSRRRRASTTRSGPRPRVRSDARRSRSTFAGRLAREKGVAVLLRAWLQSGLSAPPAALVLVGGGPIRARTAATGAAAARRAGRRRDAARLLRRLGRCGATVDPHARLPRAVGVGHQRSLRPGSPRDRNRRGRRRRRRADRARAHRPRRPGRATPTRSPAPSGACTTTPRCARASAPRRAPPWRLTRTTRGPPGWRARWPRQVPDALGRGLLACRDS